MDSSHEETDPDAYDHVAGLSDVDKGNVASTLTSGANVASLAAANAPLGLAASVELLGESRVELEEPGLSKAY